MRVYLPATTTVLRTLVDEGGLSGELLQFVQQRWQEQFGLIEVG